MKILKKISLIIFFAFLFLIYENIHAFRDGIVGFTKKDGNETGCVCHGVKPASFINVRISGPANVESNDTAIYVLTILNGPAVAGGCDIAASLGEVHPSPIDTVLKRQKSFTGADFELTHKYPKLFTNDTLRFTFRYIAPAISNVRDTLFANGNSVNLDTTSDNDFWNYAQNFIINITPKSGIANNSASIKSFKIDQNYPNPFNPETKIRFAVNKSANISMDIYDANGKVVASLLNDKYYSPGEYSLTFNAGQYNLSSGVYFYKLYSEEFSEIKKMMYVK
ncbi:MAG: choice-of-anchor V domain-containing protein [Ignavibacteria bacterium]